MQAMADDVLSHLGRKHIISIMYILCIFVFVNLYARWSNFDLAFKSFKCKVGT